MTLRVLAPLICLSSQVASGGSLERGYVRTPLPFRVQPLDNICPCLRIAEWLSARYFRDSVLDHSLFADRHD
jgi:hypothetical protein